MKLLAEPEMDSAMEMVLGCWNDLASERPIGFGAAGYIPYRAIRTWAKDEGLDAELFQLLKAVMRRMDRDRADREASKAKLNTAKKERRR